MSKDYERLRECGSVRLRGDDAADVKVVGSCIGVSKQFLVGVSPKFVRGSLGR